MIWMLLVIGAVAVGAVWVCTRLARELRAERGQHKANIAALEKKLAERAELIRKMEEADREATKKKDSLHHGTDAERFDASKRILQNITGPGDRAGKDPA